MTVGEDNSGQMALTAVVEVVQELGPKYVILHRTVLELATHSLSLYYYLLIRICQVLAGKGVAKGKRFQAKVTKLNAAARQQVEDILRQHFEPIAES